MNAAAHTQQQLSAALRFLGVDLGLKRTGLAAGNRISGTAQPLRTVKTANKVQRMAAVLAAVQEWQPDAVLIGRPCHPNGDAHDMTRTTETFCRELAAQLTIPVAMVDERYTSRQAEAMGAADVDSMAACLIVQRYLDHTVEPYLP